MVDRNTDFIERFCEAKSFREYTLVNCKTLYTFRFSGGPTCGAGAAPCCPARPGPTRQAHANAAPVVQTLHSTYASSGAPTYSSPTRRPAGDRCRINATCTIVVCARAASAASVEIGHRSAGPSPSPSPGPAASTSDPLKITKLPLPLVAPLKFYVPHQHAQPRKHLPLPMRCQSPNSAHIQYDAASLVTQSSAL